MIDFNDKNQTNNIKNIFEGNLRKSILSYNDAKQVSLYDYKNSLAYTVPVFHIFLNAVFMWGISEAGLDDDLHELFSPFRGSEKSLRFIAGIDINDSKLKKTLLAKGFMYAENSICMALDLNKLPPISKDISSLEIIKVNSKDELLKWIEPLDEVYKLKEPVKECTMALYEDLLSSEDVKWFHYVACCEGKPVSSISFFNDSPYLGLYNLATTSQARKKGFAAILILKALQELKNDGYEVCLAHSSQKAKNLFKRLNFTEYFEQGLYLYMPLPKIERKKQNFFGWKWGKKKNAD